MLKRQNLKSSDQVKIIFVQPDNPEQARLSVVGDFNDWDPTQNRLVRRANGTRSVSVTLDGGNSYRFRYFSDDGQWFNDEAADDYEPGEHGSDNCVVRT